MSRGGSVAKGVMPPPNVAQRLLGVEGGVEQVTGTDKDRAGPYSQLCSAGRSTGRRALWRTRRVVAMTTGTDLSGGKTTKLRL